MSYGKIFAARTGKPVSELETLEDIDRAALTVAIESGFKPACDSDDPTAWINACDCCPLFDHLKCRCGRPEGSGIRKKAPLSDDEFSALLDKAMPPWRRKQRFPFSLIGFVLGIVAGCLLTRIFF